MHWGPAPRFATPRSPELASFGPAIGRVAAELGQPLFPFQAFMQDVANEVEADGSWRYDTVMGFLPRRSGKTHQVKVLVAHRCSRSPIMAAITAQTRDYAVRRWAELAVNKRDQGLWHSPLRPKLRGLHVGTSKEKLMWRNDSVFYPFAPNPDANHGDPPDLVVVDELWAHSLVTKKEIQQGYRPAWSVKSGQEWLLSAAGNHRSQWLKEARAAGRSSIHDPNSRIAYFEWSVPEDSAAGLDGQELVDLVLEYHPRRDHGLRHGYLLGELAEHGRSGFLRAYGNIDEGSEGEPMVINGDSWKGRMRLGVQPPAGVRICVAVACDPGGRESTIAAAWVDPWSGERVTHTVISDEGVMWAEGYADKIGAGPDVGLVVTTNVGHGRTVAMVAENRGDQLHKMTGPDMAAAAVGWMQGVTERAGGVVHDGSMALEESLRRVDPPHGKPWTSRNGEPITAIESHSMALWGLDRMPEPEPVMPRFRIY